MATIVNAAGGVVENLGIKDESIRAIPSTPVKLSKSHIPKFFSWAVKGKANTPTICTGTVIDQLFDVKSFEKTSKFFTHACHGIRIAKANGNTVVFDRLIPEDAPKPANVRIYFDVVKKKVPNYKRNSDGSIVKNGDTGVPTLDTPTTVDGYLIKIVAENFTEGLSVGTGSMVDGMMLDEASEKSKMYPILDIVGEAEGEYYNLIGLTINAMLKDAVSPNYFTKAKVMPFEISLINRVDKFTTGKPKDSLFGAKKVKFALDPDALDPNTDASLHFEHIFPKKWHNPKGEGNLPTATSDLGDVYLYQDNIDKLLKDFVTEEVNHYNVTKEWDDTVTANSATWYDFVQAPVADIIETQKYIFNLFTLTTTHNAPYQAVQFDKSVIDYGGDRKVVSFGKDTPIYLAGGGDGTLNNASFEKAVVAKLKEYGDPASRVQNTARNVESFFYDTGFTPDTKKEFASCIGLRKDTAIVLSTRDVNLGKVKLSLSEERALAVSLMARISMFPESDEFATPAARGFIVQGDGVLKDEYVMDRLPLSLEVLNKFSKYLGGLVWKPEFAFDGGEGAVIDMMKDLWEGDFFIPETIKAALWDANLITPEPKDTKRFYFAGIQSVYNNDTSILNSAPVIAAILAINKMSDEAHRAHSGRIEENDLFADSVVAYMEKGLDGMFDPRVITAVIHKVVYTEEDKARGYVYRLVNEIYAPNMKTAMITWSVAKRAEDLPEN